MPKGKKNIISTVKNIKKSINYPALSSFSVFPKPSLWISSILLFLPLTLYLSTPISRYYRFLQPENLLFSPENRLFAGEQPPKNLWRISAHCYCFVDLFMIFCLVGGRDSISWISDLWVGLGTTSCTRMWRNWVRVCGD